MLRSRRAGSRSGCRDSGLLLGCSLLVLGFWPAWWCWFVLGLQSRSGCLFLLTSPFPFLLVQCTMYCKIGKRIHTSLSFPSRSSRLAYMDTSSSNSVRGLDGRPRVIFLFGCCSRSYPRRELPRICRGSVCTELSSMYRACMYSASKVSVWTRIERRRNYIQDNSRGPS